MFVVTHKHIQATHYMLVLYIIFVAVAVVVCCAVLLLLVVVVEHNKVQAHLLEKSTAQRSAVSLVLGSHTHERKYSRETNCLSASLPELEDHMPDTYPVSLCTYVGKP